MDNKFELKSVAAYLKKYKANIIIGIICSITGSILRFMPYYSIYKIIDGIISHNINRNLIVTQAIIVALSIIGKLILDCLANISMHSTAFKIMKEFRMNVIEHISKLNIGFFNSKGKGNIKTAIFDDIGRLETFIAHNILELTNAICVPIIIFIFLIILNWQMALALLIPAVLSIVLTMKKMQSYPELTEEYVKTIGNLNSSTGEMILAIKILKMFNVTAKKFKAYTESVKAYSNCLKNMAKVSCGPIAITIVLLDSSYLFILPIGGWLLMNGKISASTFILFALLSICFYQALFSIMNIRMGFMELKSGMKHIDEILSLSPLRKGKKFIKKHNVKEVRFKNVSFSYDKVNALEGFNLTLKPNTVTAFVGKSGAGKTTAAQLMGKFWEVNQGSIEINGIDIRDLSEKSLMDLTAFVFQDIFLLQDTIFKNITMGKEYEKKDIIKAAKMAYIHDFIMSLPNGYDTKIGSEGVKLSGGEKQRIAIARAILKDASIVILDEATSFSDIENERKIQNALESLLKGKCAVMIAHRLHTIKNADNIVVFQDGRAIEMGNHQKLIDTKGIYKKMWDIYVKTNKMGCVYD